MSRSKLAEICRAFYIIFLIIFHFLRFLFELIVPPSKKSIKGEIVLVTGGGHGIGRELAIELSILGTTVIVWDINKDSCDQTVKDIREIGGKAYGYVCDVTKTSQIKDVAVKMRQDVGEVDILVNNAGILNGGSLLDLDEAGIRRTFEINTLAHFWMIKEFIPHMMRKNHGHILNVCSMSSFTGTALLTDYSSSKYAALGFSEALLEEIAFGGYNGIKLSSLCPMFVDTGLVKTLMDPDSNVSFVLTAKETAKVAVDGMLRNYELITVPSFFWLTVKFSPLLPRKAMQYIKRTGKFHIKPQYKKEN